MNTREWDIATIQEFLKHEGNQLRLRRCMAVYQIIEVEQWGRAHAYKNPEQENIPVTITLMPPELAWLANLCLSSRGA